MPDSAVESVVILSGTEIVHADAEFLTLVGVDTPNQVRGREIHEFLKMGESSLLLDQINAIEAGDAPALGQVVHLQAVTGHTQDVVAFISAVDWDGDTHVQVSFVSVSVGDDDVGFALQDRAADKAPIGITMSDPSKSDNPLIYVNEGFLTLTGYSRDEVLGRNCRFLQGEQTREEPVAELRAAIDAERPVTVELRNYRKDGSLFWNRVTISPVRTRSGEVTHFVGYQEDITDAKLQEREKELFKRQADAADHSIFITDRDGTIVYVNPAFERQTGYTASEAIGQTPRILKSGEHGAAFYEDLWERITAGDVWESQMINETKYGERYEVEQTILPIVDDRGEITHFASIEKNITDQVIKEQALNVLNRVLRHNLRSAITVIEGHTELLETELPTADHQAAIESIQKQTTAMRKLADRTATIRSLVEEESGAGLWDMDYLATIVAGYRDNYPAATIDLTVDIDDSIKLPSGDLFQLALDEAIDNAVVHTEKPPEIEIAVTRADSEHVEIRVADNGPGIPENERDAIEAGIETPLCHGTGVGLWIIEWVTARLGGKFTISDDETEGTTLTFRLPTAVR